MHKNKSGFALISVLITGTIMILMLASILQVLSVSRKYLADQHYQLLSRQAAESGIARAQDCINRNNKSVTWTVDKPLRPNTDCFGNAIVGAADYVLKSAGHKTSFEIKPPDVQEEYHIISALGKLDFIRNDDSVWKTYDSRLSAFIRTGITFNDVVFGSLYVGSGYNDLYARSGQSAGFRKAVYFFTKSSVGVISSVGYNIDGVLTGYNSHDALPWANRLTSDPKEWYSTPHTLPKPGGNNVPVKSIFTDFQGNGWNAFFLGSDGRTIYSTGSNINCDLGLGLANCSSNEAARPIWEAGESKMNLSNIPINEKVVSIYLNGSTFLLTDAGKLYASGVVNLSPGMGSSFSNSSKVYKPSLVKSNYAAFNSSVIKKFYTDRYYNLEDGTLAVAVTEDGWLYGWGVVNGGGLSLTKIPKLLLSPSQTGGKKIVDAVTDGGTIWALDESGSVWSAGKNLYGQLARNYNGEADSNFQKITIPSNKTITKIAADGFSVLFLAVDGDVYGAGLNNASQLGFPKSTPGCTIKVPRYAWGWPTGKYDEIEGCSKQPKLYQLPNGIKAKDIFIVSPGVFNPKGNNSHETEADRYRNSFIVTKSGEVYGAGSNYHGQLGIGSNVEYDIPKKMILDNSNSDSAIVGVEAEPVVAAYVRSGIGTTIVIDESNFVFTVGNNANGQLGAGDTVERHIPKRHRYTNQSRILYY